MHKHVDQEKLWDAFWMNLYVFRGGFVAQSAKR